LSAPLEQDVRISKYLYTVFPEHSLYPWHVIDCFATLQDDSTSKLELESRYAEENKKIQKNLVQDDSVSKLELESRYGEENKKIQKELVGLFLLMCFSLYFLEIQGLIYSPNYFTLSNSPIYPLTRLFFFVSPCTSWVLIILWGDSGHHNLGWNTIHYVFPSLCFIQFCISSVNLLLFDILNY